MSLFKRKMSYVILGCSAVLQLLVSSKGALVAANATQSISVMHYNVENLFDTVRDPKHDDRDFTPEGKFHWDDEKLKFKFQHLAAVISSVSGMNGAKCPDVLALSEVENAQVLQQWKAGALAVCKYNITVIDPQDPDMRGIRTALLTRLPLAAKPTRHIAYQGGRFILEVPLKVESSTLIVFTNHWKSRAKRGNDDGGEGKRIQAGQTLRKRIDVLLAQNPSAEILALGDLNDEFENTSISKALRVVASPNEALMNEGNPLWETAFDLYANPQLRNFDGDEAERDRLFKLYRSSYYFARERAHNQLDHILISRGLLDGRGLSFQAGSFRVVRFPAFTDKQKLAPIPFMRKGTTANEDPESDGGAYGASDHFPVAVRLDIRQ